MNTQVVKLDADLNKYLWSQGIRNPPKKLRLVLERKPLETGEEEPEQGKQQYYTLIKYKLVPSFANLRHTRVTETGEQAQE
jgi:large subunit ribosomal protein L31e